MSPTQTAPDLLSSLKTGWNDAMQQWWDQTQTAIDPWKQAWESVVPAATGQHAGMPYGHHHRHGSRPHHGGEPTHCGSYHDHATYGESCHCESCHGHSTYGETCHCESCHGHSTHGETCHCESCHGEKDGCASPCHCRVPDADVVLHARAGEQRVIAFVLRNPWRREREVSIAVGSWQVCDGGRLEVQSVVEAGESVTLQPHEKRVVRLMVMMRGICDDPKDPKDPNDPKDRPKDNTNASDQRFGCDVDSCVSAYADVRFEGCARPQRVGVVVHPATCDAIALPCDCGCC